MSVHLLIGKLSSDVPAGAFSCASTSAEATSSKDSFLRLLTKPKIVLICFVIFTLSAGLGFLDATLSLFAIDTVNIISFIVNTTHCGNMCHPPVCFIIIFFYPPCLSLNSYLATLGSSGLGCPCHIVWHHRCWDSLPINTLYV